MELVDDTGYTPLQIAACADHADAVRLLLNAGACADVASATDGRTSLHLTSDAEIVRLLLEAMAPTDTPDADGRTALHEAALATWELHACCWTLGRKGSLTT